MALQVSRRTETSGDLIDLQHVQVEIEGLTEVLVQGSRADRGG